jgi:hypothetical protein
MLMAKDVNGENDPRAGIAQQEFGHRQPLPLVAQD